MRWFVVWLLVLVAPARAEDATRDEWAVLRMMGSDAGYVHTQVRRQGDLLETREVSSVTIKRMGQAITIRQVNVTVERADGTLVRMRTTGRMSAAETRSEVTFRDGKAHVVTTVLDTDTRSVVDCPADALGPRGLDRLAQRAARAPGQPLQAHTFYPSFDRFLETVDFDVK